MKIAIVTYEEYINVPYIHKYERLIAQNGDKYDVILWDRRGCGGKHPNNHYVFRAKIGKSKILKLIPFLKWRNFTLRTLKTGQYDEIIVLTTLPAVLIADFLLFKYEGNFFFDLRDFTYEGLYPYKKLVNFIIQKSAATSISSNAFMQFLTPSSKIVITHNISNEDAAGERFQPTTDGKRMTIGFVGGLRYYKENCHLLTELKNSNRFQLRYVGKAHPGCDLPAFCQKNGIHNAEFFPAYENAQKPKIYQEIDLINAVYGNKTCEVLLALPNKLYDCILFKKPIIVSEGTYLAEIVKQYHLGIAINVEQDDVKMVLNHYLDSFDPCQFEEGCKAFLKLVCREEKIARQRIADFLEEMR